VYDVWNLHDGIVSTLENQNALFTVRQK